MRVYTTFIWFRHSRQRKHAAAFYLTHSCVKKRLRVAEENINVFDGTFVADNVSIESERVA